jgi:hypothetical protein
MRERQGRDTCHERLNDAASRDTAGGQHVRATESGVGRGVGVTLHIGQAVLPNQVAAEVPEPNKLGQTNYDKQIRTKKMSV